MGDSQTLVAGGVGTGFTVALFIVYRFLIPLATAANHKRIRSVCCGWNCITSVDIEDTSPVTHSNRRVQVPMPTPTTTLPHIRVDTTNV
jgi:hypothetical protein